MPELIKQGRVFIAQPPLYYVKRGKKSEYVLNEKRMRNVLRELGQDGTTLIAYNDFEGDRPEQTRIEGSDLSTVLDLLEQIEEMVEILSRRGITFEMLANKRSDDPDGENRLPTLMLTVPAAEGSSIAGDYFFWSEQQVHAFREAHGLSEADPELDEVIGEDDQAAQPGQSGPGDARQVTRKDLHEVRELERLFSRLAEFGLTMDDYFYTRREAVTGQTMPTRFDVVTHDGKGHEHTFAVANLAEVQQAIFDAGKQGMHIKRFKGLGEMDARELWETTMNPENRVLLRVTWDAASEAEHLFSVLMGEEVEPRRKYIEDHALEVKNLDV
jgi:DNA gyrase subunit B